MGRILSTVVKTSNGNLVGALQRIGAGGEGKEGGGGGGIVELLERMVAPAGETELRQSGENP